MKNASQPRLQRKIEGVRDVDQGPWPSSPPGYTFLGDAVGRVYRELFLGNAELSQQRIDETIEQIRQDALAGSLALGHFDGDDFAVLTEAKLRAKNWPQLFLSCRVGSADVFVRDAELANYVRFIDGSKAAN
jgi:hypothetical protein